MSSSPRRVDLIISGAGLVGSALALAAGHEAMSVALIDSAPTPDSSMPFDGRASTIARASWSLFERIALASPLREHAEPIRAIRVADSDAFGRVSPQFVHFEKGAPFGYVVENTRIRLVQARLVAAHSAISSHYSTRIASWSADEGGVTVALSDGSAYRAPLLIAAEGRNSTLRAQARIRCTSHSYGQRALVLTVKHEHEHAGTAVELFHPRGPFAMLPMTKRRSNIVWTESSDFADKLMSLPQDQFLPLLHERFGNWLGSIAVESPPQCYELKAFHAERYGGERLVLVGDAAHVIHPIAGQGLNLGFGDIAELMAQILRRRRLGLDWGSQTLIKDYERARRPANTAMLLATHGLERLFSNSHAVFLHSRRLGLQAFQHMPALKSAFARYAMGFVPNLPPLMAEMSTTKTE